MLNAYNINGRVSRVSELVRVTLCVEEMVEPLAYIGGMAVHVSYLLDWNPKYISPAVYLILSPDSPQTYIICSMKARGLFWI